MALLVPNAGEGLAIKAFLNHTAPQDPVLRLFTNNITPAETDTAGTYTEAAGGGYASKTLTGSSWSIVEGAPTNGSYAQQTWTFTGALTGNATVYGYYFTQLTSGIIMWAERAASSFQPQNNGDQILITPSIDCDD